MGLTIAKGLIKLHGGKISVSSKENKGTTFTVIFPINHQPSPLVKQSNFLLERTVTILVVEDDIFLREGLCDLLELTQDQPYQFRTMSAENGIEALKVLEQTSPDLIISDIRMPYMDGYGFLENVRKNPEWLQIPFVFLTAKGDQQEIHMGRQLGVEEYIVKPYNSREVIAMLVAKLARNDEVQQVFQKDFANFKREILTLLEPNFRAPLDSVTSFSSEIATHLDTVKTDDELKEALTGLKSASWELSRLVEDFIMLAEIKSGETAAVIKHESTQIPNPHRFLLDIEQRCRHLFSLDDITFFSDDVATLPPIFGEKRTFEISLERLLMGCVQLTRRNTNPVLSLHTLTESNQVCFKLHLPQVEMPASELTLLHQITQQIEGIKYTESEIGTALAVTTGIIHLHNGHIQIDYEEQQGISFTVKLPTIE